MVLASFKQVFLIYMFVFGIFGDYVTFKYKVCHVFLNLDGSYVLHNYCEMWGALEPRLTNAKTMGDNLARFGVNRLPIVKE
jgi:hypothetical protein